MSHSTVKRYGRRDVRAEAPLCFEAGAQAADAMGAALGDTLS